MVWLPCFRSDAVPVPLVLYTRADCPLCDEMKREIERSGLKKEIQLTEVDVDSDRELKRAYGLRIPVLALGGVLLGEGRLDSRQFKRRFRRAADDYRRGVLRAAREGS